MTPMEEQGYLAKLASRVLAVADTETKNAALLAMADGILARSDYILKENALDLAAGREHGLSEGLLDRLALTHDRLVAIAEGVRQVADLPDPIGGILSRVERPNGLVIEKRRVPLGVIGIIYEARPNVTVDAAALCIKAGNAVILRGGKEAFRSNQAFVTVLRDCLSSANLPADCLHLVQDTSRQSARELMELTGYLDVLIPRGGAGLIRAVVDGAKVPVIETGAGVCHVYIDKDADFDMATDIVYNAKVSRPSVCNATECVLVHGDIAPQFLPRLKAKLDEKPVELRGCDRTLEVLTDIKSATELDWDTEFGDYILAVKVVDDVADAMEFIAVHTTGHSEAIVTANEATAKVFLDGVDAAAVYHNASTRFTDGFEFGLGAEIGISTQKIHARGPMGLAELTSSKSVIYGKGQVRG